jgi:hypothetical protein
VAGEVRKSRTQCPSRAPNVARLASASAVSPQRASGHRACITSRSHYKRWVSCPFDAQDWNSAVLTDRERCNGTFRSCAHQVLSVHELAEWLEPELGDVCCGISNDAKERQWKWVLRERVGGFSAREEEEHRSLHIARVTASLLERSHSSLRHGLANICLFCALSFEWSAETELEKKLKRNQARKKQARKVPLWLDMVYDDFSHREVLETLDFTGYKLTDETLKHVLAARGVAESLRYGCAFGFPRRAICNLIRRGLASVPCRKLVLHKCIILTDNGVLAVLRCRDLATLDISGCPELPDSMFTQLTQLRRLKSLDASGARHLTSATVIQLMHTYENSTDFLVARWRCCFAGHGSR